MQDILKSKTRVSSFFVALIAGLSLLAVQASAQDSTPSADQIIEKYIQAVGGKAAMEKLTSRVSTGSFEVDVMPGSSSQEIYEKAPNKQLWVTDLANFGVFRRGFNGTMGWQDNPQTGLQEVTGNQLAELKRSAEFQRDLKLKELYPKTQVKGKEKVNARDAYVVEATPAEGPAALMYFDAESGLLVRTQGQSETPSGTVTVDTTFEDYREVDGIKLPFVTRVSRPEFGFVIRLTEVKHNVPIDDAKFDMPGAK